MASQPSQYGYEHKKQRARLLPKAYGKPCPMCGQLMTKTQHLDLDHSLPLVLGGGMVGDRIVHATCNRAAGAALGNTLRKRGRAASQDW